MPSSQEVTFTPLGTLSILPRELRDEIYRRVYNLVYFLDPYPRTFGLKWWSYKYLAVSKSIRQESLAIIHAEGKFVIEEELLLKAWFPRAWTRNDILFSHQIQNVEFTTSACTWSDEYYIEQGMDYSRENSKILKKDAVAMPFFTGTEVLRKTCVIRFYVPMKPKMILILQSPFFGVIKHLTGFATVVLRMRSKEKDWVAREVLTYIGEDPSYTDYAVGFRVLVDAMSSALEQTLGPSVISLNSDYHPFPYVWTITFRPRDFSSKKKNLDPCSTSQVNEVNEALSRRRDIPTDEASANSTCLILRT